MMCLAIIKKTNLRYIFKAVFNNLFSHVFFKFVKSIKSLMLYILNFFVFFNNIFVIDLLIVFIFFYTDKQYIKIVKINIKRVIRSKNINYYYF